MPTDGSRAFALTLAAAILLAGAWAGCKRTRSTPPPDQTPSTQYDAGYAGALAAANEFCHAWRRGDLEAGKALLSRRILRTFPDIRIRDAIVGLPSPQHVAFEIAGGSRGDDGSMTFGVRLFYRFLGQADERIEGPAETIALRRDDAGVWRVDRFRLLDEPDPHSP